jgi:hypothetical protein
MGPFYTFEWYPNTYCTKLKGNPPKNAFVTPKNGDLNMPRPMPFVCNPSCYPLPTFWQSFHRWVK